MIIYVFSHHTIVVGMEHKLKYWALLVMINIDIARCIPDHSYVSVSEYWVWEEAKTGKCHNICPYKKLNWKTLNCSKVYFFGLDPNTMVVARLRGFYLQDLSTNIKEKPSPTWGVI